jgi:hypothetical protein
VLGPADTDYKAGAALRTEVPHEVDGYMYVDPKYFGDPDIVQRRYLCPGCGRLLANEFGRTDDEPHSDCRIEVAAR